MSAVMSYITPEQQYKLDLSKQETEDLAIRDLRCPNCHFLINRVYGDICGHLEFKCPKCKEKYIINFSYFRTRVKCRQVTLIKVDD